MSDDLIYVEPKQEAVLHYDDMSVTCPSVPEAWLAWAQLELDQKQYATIEISNENYDMQAIRGMRFSPISDAA